MNTRPLLFPHPVSLIEELQTFSCPKQSRRLLPYFLSYFIEYARALASLYLARRVVVVEVAGVRGRVPVESLGAAELDRDGAGAGALAEALAARLLLEVAFLLQR